MTLLLWPFSPTIKWKCQALARPPAGSVGVKGSQQPVSCPTWGSSPSWKHTARNVFYSFFQCIWVELVPWGLTIHPSHTVINADWKGRFQKDLERHHPSPLHPLHIYFFSLSEKGVEDSGQIRAWRSLRACGCLCLSLKQIIICGLKNTFS